MAEVKLTILGEDRAAGAFKSVDSAVGSLKGTLAALGVTWAAMKVADYIKDAALLAARYETLGVTMKVVGNTAGYTGEQMDGFEARLRKTGIAMVEARQNLTSMAQAHIDLSKSSELARIAQDAAVIGGINSSEAFSRMVYGIQSAQVEVLRTIGLNVNFEDSYKKLGRQLGKSAEDLTEYEKVQARTNVVMEKGKDIAGSYEAAMGTAGKQITSLKRYIDDLKVKAGEVFHDALLIGVEQLTGGLKDMNDEAGQLKQKGQLDAWGRDATMALAFTADAVRGVILTFKALGSTIAWSASTLISWGKIGWSALKLDFSGAKAEYDQMSRVTDEFVKDMDQTFSASTFQQKAKEYYALKDANAGKDKAQTEEAEKRRMAAGEAARKEAEAKAQAAVEEKKFLENVKNSLDTIKDYSSAMKELGKQRLEFSNERYTDKLKEEVELYKEGKRAADDLITPLRRYNTEANAVFNERLNGERSALDRIGALYTDFKNKIAINALTKEAKTAGVDILKAYRETAEGIIATEQDRYKTLLEGERGYANQVLSLLQAKKKEIEELKQRFMEANKLFDEQKRTALQGSYVTGDYRYLDNSLDPYEKRQAMIDKLRRDETAALQIQDPSRRTAELQKVADGWSSLTGAVESTRKEVQRVFVDDGSWGGKIEEKLVDVATTLVTQEDAYKQAGEERKRIQDEILASAENEQSKLESLYQKTIDKMETYKQKLLDIDNILQTLTRTITIDLRVNGMEQLNRMQGLVGQATSSPFSSSSSDRTDYGDYYTQGGNTYWANGSLADNGMSYVGASGSSGMGWVGAYATGTDYVPRTGLALIHQGERIIPADQNKPGAMGNTTISFGDLQFVLPNVTNQSSANDLARSALPEIERLLRTRFKAA